MNTEFGKWLDEILLGERIQKAVGIDFNIRKAGIGYWSVEVKASETSRKIHNTGDWPLFRFGMQAQEYEVQMEVMRWLQAYMKTGKQADVLRKKQGFGVGFV